MMKIKHQVSQMTYVAVEIQLQELQNFAQTIRKFAKLMALEHLDVKIVLLASAQVSHLVAMAGYVFAERLSLITL